MVFILKKSYACDLTVNGTHAGSGVTTIWFWQLPNVAHRKLIENKPSDANVSNFRRIK